MWGVRGRVRGVGFGVQGEMSRVKELGCRVWGSGCLHLLGRHALFSSRLLQFGVWRFVFGVSRSAKVGAI